MIIKELWVEGRREDNIEWVQVVVINLFKAQTINAESNTMTELMHALYFHPRNGEINQELLSETFIKTLWKDEKGREPLNFSAPPRKEDWGKEDRQHHSTDNGEA